jgi:hypothetical protein
MLIGAPTAAGQSTLAIGSGSRLIGHQWSRWSARQKHGFSTGAILQLLPCAGLRQQFGLTIRTSIAACTERRRVSDRRGD